MAERAAKMQRVEAFRRKVPHVSATALASILKEVSEVGAPPGGTDRTVFREAREAVVTADGPYGPIVQMTELPPEDPGPGIPLTFAHPFATLAHACKSCKPFWRFVKERLSLIHI